jgi:hypothetical protein
MSGHTPGPGQSGGNRRVAVLLAQGAGLALLVAAVVVVVQQRGELAGAWSAARSAPWPLLAAMLLLPLVNWAITSTIFWALMRGHGRVGLWEMSALIGSAWLLNMLPFKPGLVGRIAYHKAISNIPIRTTLAVTLIALLSGSAGIMIALGAQVAFDAELRAVVPRDRLVAIALGVGVLAAAVAGAIAVRRGWKEIRRHAGALALAVLLRIADTHVWALRYVLAFRLIGHEQPYGVCVVIAGVSQIAGQIPISLGFREWVVGGSASMLRGTPLRGLQGASAAPGLMADLLCRAVEIACALPVGLISSAWIYRRLARKPTPGDALEP